MTTIPSRKFADGADSRLKDAEGLTPIDLLRSKDKQGNVINDEKTTKDIEEVLSKTLYGGAVLSSKIINVNSTEMFKCLLSTKNDFTLIFGTDLCQDCIDVKKKYSNDRNAVFIDILTLGQFFDTQLKNTFNLNSDLPYVVKWYGKAKKNPYKNHIRKWKKKLNDENATFTSRRFFNEVLLNIKQIKRELKEN